MKPVPQHDKNNQINGLNSKKISILFDMCMKLNKISESLNISIGFLILFQRLQLQFHILGKCYEYYGQSNKQADEAFTTAEQNIR